MPKRDRNAEAENSCSRGFKIVGQKVNVELHFFLPAKTTRELPGRPRSEACFTASIVLSTIFSVFSRPPS